MKAPLFQAASGAGERDISSPGWDAIVQIIALHLTT